MVEYIKRILKRITPQAEEVINDDKKRENLLKKAIAKVPQLRKGGVISEIINEVKWLIKMITSYFKGEYQEISLESVLVVLASIIYFVNPLDLMPDLLPGGVLDDAAILGFVIKTVNSDIEHYKQWFNIYKENQEENYSVESIE